MSRARKVRKERRQGVLLVPVYTEDNPRPIWRQVVGAPRLIMAGAVAEDIALRVMKTGDALTQVGKIEHPA
jgi:hypothetical protein